MTTNYQPDFGTTFRTYHELSAHELNMLAGTPTMEQLLSQRLLIQGTGQDEEVTDIHLWLTENATGIYYLSKRGDYCVVYFAKSMDMQNLSDFLQRHRS